jgi:hypothetical protein
VGVSVGRCVRVAWTPVQTWPMAMPNTPCPPRTWSAMSAYGTTHLIAAFGEAPLQADSGVMTLLDEVQFRVRCTRVPHLLASPRRPSTGWTTNWATN